MDAKEWRDSTLKELKELKCSYDKIKEGNPRKDGQYDDIIYWIHISFDKKYKLKPEYEDADGINIMPYTITEQDMLKAELQSKDFNVRINGNAGLVDFDGKSCNFHKMPGGNLQFVLTEKGKGGPGNSKDETGFKVHGKNIRRHWYFNSNLTMENEPKDIKEMLEMIGKQIFKEVNPTM